MLSYPNFVSMGLALWHIQFKLATFPKLPLPMALRIWKWSKFTEKKKVTDIILGAFDYIIKIKMAIFVHYGEIKYSTIMVWYFSSTNTANTNQSGLSVKLNSALPVLPSWAISIIRYETLAAEM